MLAATLRENGRKVVRFGDLFRDQETKDAVWVHEVCARGYIVITKDKNLLEHTNALMAWHRNKGKIFYIASGAAGEERVIEAVMSALRRMEQIISTLNGPFYVRVLISGEVELVRPELLPDLS